MGEEEVQLPGRLGVLAAKTSGITALGSVVIYLFGYLVLRFQLTAYGVVTDLDAFDEKYFFAGCRFLVFLCMALPSIALVLSVLLGLGALPWRLLPRTRRAQACEALVVWFQRPLRGDVLAFLATLLFIQLCLRQCVLLADLLLAPALPRAWISAVLLADESARGLYFTALVAGVCACAGLFLLTLKPARPGPVARGLRWATAVGVAIEVLLLAVNFGVLVGTPSLPAVEAPGEAGTDARAWLAWSSKESLVYLVCDGKGGRTLVSLSRAEREVRIVGIDQVFDSLFDRKICAAAPR